MDVMRLLLSVINQVSQQLNFHTAGTNLAVICLLLPFLHTKITLTQSARRIQLCVVDYPSPILLVLLPASFLLRPAFFWKVSVIITAVSLLFNCISGLLRRRDQGNQGFPVPSPQEADDDVGVAVETGIPLSATPPVRSNEIQGVEARTRSGMLPVILLRVPPALLRNGSAIITALSLLLNSIFSLLRRPNQGNQGVSGISHVRFPGDAIGLATVGADQIPEVAVDCEAVGADLVDADGDQVPAEAVNDMNDLADGLGQPEAIDVELREFP